jgi:SSS family solute:Na+ symporter
LGLGLTALLAAFMSGMAGNVTAFNTVFTYDIYRPYIYQNASDRHLLNVGRIVTLAGVVISVLPAYIVLAFNSLFDYVQTLGAIYQAPLFAVFVIGMFWKRGTPWGGFWSLLVGTTVAIAIYIGQTLGIITNIGEAGTVGAAFWQAWWAFFAAVVVGAGVSLFTQRKPDEELAGLVYGTTEKDVNAPPQPFYKNVWVIGGSLMVCLVVLNIIFF